MEYTEVDIRLQEVIQELADMPLDIARAITNESKKTWLYKPTLFQINDNIMEAKTFFLHVAFSTSRGAHVFQKRKRIHRFNCWSFSMYIRPF